MTYDKGEKTILTNFKISNSNLGTLLKLKNKRMGISSIERYSSHELYSMQTRN